MKFGTVTVFLGLSVFLHSVELISSQPDDAEHTTLTQLFPQSNGVHFPVIEEINLEKPGFLTYFPKLNGHKQQLPAANYLKRGNVIFGYEDERKIALLDHLFLQPNTYAVFEIENYRWYTLSLRELQTLGVGSSLSPNFAEHTTLIKLFPQSNGVHFPDIEELKYTNPVFLTIFERLNGYKQVEKTENYFKRGNFIFGYERHRHIALLGRLFNQPHLYPVFDTENRRWYTLSLSELRRLGVGRNLALVHAQDEAHALVHYPYQQFNSEAHNAACDVAYRKTKDFEGTFGKLSVDKYTEEDGAKTVKDYYHREYIKAFHGHAAGPSGGR